MAPATLTETHEEAVGNAPDTATPVPQSPNTKQKRTIHFADAVDEREIGPAPDQDVYTFSARRHQAAAQAYVQFKGYRVEGLTGQQRTIRQRWLTDWIKELKDRLPPFTLDKLGIDKNPKDVSEDQVQGLLELLPEHEVRRFETMYTRTMGMVNSMAAAMDTDFINQHISNALDRFHDHKKAYIERSYEREAQEHAAKMAAKPWEFAVDNFHKRVDAATVIQRRFRKFRESCQLRGFYPSDENPEHWKHWVEFRKKHGWADEELVDAYGDPVERTDGGKKIKSKKGMMPPHVKARYLESIGHHKDERSRPPSRARTIATMHKEIADAMRSYDKAQMLTEIIANRWLRLQERAMRRAQWFAVAEAKRAAGLDVEESDGVESDTDEEEEDKALPAAEREKRRQERFIAFVSDPEVQKILDTGVDAFQPSGVTLNPQDLRILSQELTHRLTQRLSQQLSQRLSGQAPPILTAAELDLNPAELRVLSQHLSELGLDPSLLPTDGGTVDVAALQELTQRLSQRLSQQLSRQLSQRLSQQLCGQDAYPWISEDLDCETSVLPNSRPLSSAGMRDLGSGMSGLLTRSNSSHMTALLNSFQLAHRYKLKLMDARKKGDAVLPRPPMDLGPDVLKLYADIMTGVVETYQLDLEKALREGRVPPPPPEGISKASQDMYDDIMANIRRLETGYDTDDAEEDAPRVRRLTKYGQAWLQAMEKSSVSRRRLLRTRSQGTLGAQNAALYRPADAPKPRYNVNQRDSDDEFEDDTVDCAQDAGQVSKGRAPPKRQFTFRDLSVSHATTLQPLTASVAFKLHGSVASNSRRRTRPLVVMDTQELEGVDWSHTSNTPTGQELDVKLKRKGFSSIIPPALPPPAGTRELPKSIRSVRARALTSIAAQNKGFASVAASAMLLKAAAAVKSAADGQEEGSIPLPEMSEDPQAHSSLHGTDAAPGDRDEPSPFEAPRGSSVFMTAGDNTAGLDEDIEKELIAMAEIELSMPTHGHGMPLATLQSNSSLQKRLSRAPSIAHRAPSVTQDRPLRPAPSVRAPVVHPALVYQPPSRNDPRSLSHFIVSPPSNPSSVSVPTSLKHHHHHHHHAPEPQAGEYSAASALAANFPKLPTTLLARMSSLQAHAYAAEADPSTSSVGLRQVQPSQPADGLGGDMGSLNSSVLDVPGRVADAFALGLHRGPNNPNRSLALARLAVSFMRPAGEGKSGSSSRVSMPSGKVGTEASQPEPGRAKHQSDFGPRPARMSESAPGAALGDKEEEGAQDEPTSEQGQAAAIGPMHRVALDAFVGLFKNKSKAPRRSMAEVMGKVPNATAGALLWRRAKAAVHRLLDSYPAEVGDMMREAGLADLAPKQLLDQAMSILRAPRKLQLEDCGEVVEVKKRPLSAGTTRDVDRAAALAIAHHGATQATVATQGNRLVGKPTLPGARPTASHRMADLAMTAGGLARSGRQPEVRALEPEDSDEAAALVQVGWQETSRAWSQGGLCRDDSTAKRRSMAGGVSLRRRSIMGTAARSARPSMLGEPSEVMSPSGNQQGEVPIHKSSTGSNLAHILTAALDASIPEEPHTHDHAAQEATGSPPQPGSPSRQRSFANLSAAANTRLNATLSRVATAMNQSVPHHSVRSRSGACTDSEPGLEEEPSEEEFMGASANTGPFSFLGAVLADVFMEEQKLKKQEEQRVSSLNPLFQGAQDKRRQAKQALDTQLAVEKAEKEWQLLEHYRRLHGGHPAGGRTLYRVDRMHVHKVSKEERRAMQQRYVQLFKSHEYGWLHQHLRRGVVPDTLGNSSSGAAPSGMQAEPSAAGALSGEGSSTDPSGARLTRATLRRRSRQAAAASSTSPSPTREPRSPAKHTAQPTATPAPAIEDPVEPLVVERSRLGTLARVSVSGGSNRASMSGADPGAPGSGQGSARVSTSGVSPSAVVAKLKQDVSPSRFSTAGTKETSSLGATRPGTAGSAFPDIGSSAGSAVDGEGVSAAGAQPEASSAYLASAKRLAEAQQRRQTLPAFTVAPQDWGWAQAGMGQDGTPAWLARLVLRTQQASKAGLTSGGAQRQRFQQAAAMHQRSTGTPAEMHQAVTVHQPSLPGPIDPSNPLLGTLPSGYTRPVGGTAALSVDKQGTSCAVSMAGVVAAPSRPYSDLSPPRHPSPPKTQEVITPFGSQNVPQERQDMDVMNRAVSRSLPSGHAPAGHSQQASHAGDMQAKGARTMQQRGVYRDSVRASAPAGLFMSDGSALPTHTPHFTQSPRSRGSPRMGAGQLPAINAISVPPSRIGRSGLASPQTPSFAEGLVLTTTPNMVKPRRAVPATFLANFFAEPPPVLASPRALHHIGH